MKKKSLIYTKLSALLLLVLLGSCKKEELRSKELLVFLQGDKAGMAAKTLTVPFVHNPLFVEGNKMIEIPVYASREVPADITVYISPDTRLVDAYNQQNGTTSLELPANTFQVQDAGAGHVVPAGASKSDPVKIEITHPELLTDPAGYILPLTITGIESKDKGVGVSSTHATVYVRITYAFNNVEQSQSPLTGTALDRTAWSVSVSNTSSGTQGSAIVDGNNSTSWRSSNSSSAAKWAVIDMGSAQTVKGFQIVPNYASASENATRMTISSSMDDVTWTTQGEWNGTGPASGSNAAAPDIKGVNFIAPVEGRYFRFDITARVSGNRVGFAEVNAIQ